MTKLIPVLAELAMIVAVFIIAVVIKNAGIMVWNFGRGLINR